MFTSIKRLALVCCILTACAFAGAVLVVLYLIGSHVGTPLVFTGILFTGTIAAFFLLTAIAMTSLCDMLELNAESTAKQIYTLSKRIEALENKTKLY